MDNYSFIGSGILYLEEIGGTAGAIDVGNCSRANIRPQEESKKLANFRDSGGGTYSEVKRASGLELSYTFHDFSPANFARALRGKTTALATAAVTETHVANAGGFIAVANLAASITSVEVSGVPADVGTDYVVRPGGIYIPAGSGIDGETVEIVYQRAASTRVDALTDAAKQYRLVLVGENEARGGKLHRLEVYRLSHGLLQEFAAIGEDYGAGEVTGEILVDTVKKAAGGSGFFDLQIQD